MLVLVAGATGNVGQKLIESLLRRGHRVRALGRNPQKLAPALRDRLESFVESTSYWDAAALEAACAAPVDAVICAYASTPELQLEGQLLLLLRAAERAGSRVRVFVAATWNYDWRRLPGLGAHESYDPYLCFQRQAELSSGAGSGSVSVSGRNKLKPAYILSGVMGEVLFAATPGHAYYTAGEPHHGVWDPDARAFDVWGDRDFRWHWTSEADAAEFAVAIAERPDAADGGFWTVCSGVHSLKEMAEAYGRVRGAAPAVLRQRGSVEELRERALEARRRCGDPSRFWEYIGWFYTLHTVDGTWTLGELDNDKLGVKGTSLEDFFRAHPGI